MCLESHFLLSSSEFSSLWHELNEHRKIGYRQLRHPYVNTRKQNVFRRIKGRLWEGQRVGNAGGRGLLYHGGKQRGGGPMCSRLHSGWGILGVILTAHVLLCSLLEGPC